MKNHNRKLATAVLIILGVLLTITAVLAFSDSLKRDIDRAKAEQIAEAEVYGLPADAPAEGIGNTQATHTQSIACVGQRTSVMDIGCPDWNYNTAIYGWDGHTAEVWEITLFSMCFYKEFWGASLTCCEAGCDAMLNLYASGLFGNTLGECMSAVNDFGQYVYSVYPDVWTTEYDAEGLAWCKAFCLERFTAGPLWECEYFRLYQYHDTSWSIPLYEIDGVYFSMGKRW